MFHTSQTYTGARSPVPFLQCNMRLDSWWAELRSHVANQVYVVIEVADKVIRDVMSRSASVPDKLPLGHFVFDVGAGQVDGQQDQTVAQHVHSVCRANRDRQSSVVCSTKTNR